MIRTNKSLIGLIFYTIDNQASNAYDGFSLNNIYNTNQYIYIIQYMEINWQGEESKGVNYIGHVKQSKS